MIYVCGTSLDVSQLPLSDVLSYSIQNEKTKVMGTLRMGIRKPDVVSCYVNKQLFGDMPANDACLDKIVYFNSDDELVSLLGAKSTADEAPVVEEPAPAAPEAFAVTGTDEEAEAMQAELDAADAKRQAEEEAQRQEALEQGTPIAEEEPIKAEELSDEVEEVKPTMFIPASEEDVSEADMLRNRLKTMEQAYQQNRDCLAERTTERDQLYEMAVAQIAEQAAEYEEKLKEAQAVVESLRSKLEKASNTTGPLSPFEVYAEKSRAIVKAGLTLENPVKGICAVSSGSADSAVTLYQSLSLLALSGFNGYIIDLTGDGMFALTLRNIACKQRYTMYPVAPQQLSEADYNACAIDTYTHNFVDFLKHTKSFADTLHTNFGKSKIAFSGYYHDISLLPYDWEQLLNEISAQAMGAPVILVLPSVTSFVGRYLCSYLSTVIPVNIATICVPSALIGTQTNLNAIPAGRIRLLIMNYMNKQASDSILRGELNAKYTIKTFIGNTVFAEPRPTADDFNRNFANNNKIWAEAMQFGR